MPRSHSLIKKPNMALKGTCRLMAVLKFCNLQALGLRLASVSGTPLSSTLGIAMNTPINQTKISELWPGETLLVTERIARNRQTLAAGGSLSAIHVHQSEERLVVRDGNNRVRAYIEHCREHGLPIDRMPSIIGAGEAPKPRIHILWGEIAARYGGGIEAFLALPVADENEYFQNHGVD